MSFFNFTDQMVLFTPSGTPSILALAEGISAGDILIAPQNNYKYNLEQSKLLDNIFVGVDWPNWDCIHALKKRLTQELASQER